MIKVYSFILTVLFSFVIVPVINEGPVIQALRVVKIIYDESKHIIPTYNCDLKIKDKDGNIRITEKDIEYFEIEKSSGGEGYSIVIVFTEGGSINFGELTEESIGERIEIYNHDDLIGSPIVNSAIYDGSACIYGGQTYKEAEECLELILGENSN